MSRDISKPDIENLVDAVPGAIYRVDLNADPKNEFIFLSKKIEELSGYSCEEFLSGKLSWFDLVVKEDLPIVHKVIKASPRDKSYRLEYRIKDRIGRIRWVLNQGCITEKNNKPTWSDGVILDITMSKKQEQELELRQQELNNLVSSLDDVVLVIDVSGYIRNFFTKAWRFLMMPPAAFLNKTIAEAFVGLPSYASLFEETYRKTIDDEKNLEIEYSVQDQNQNKFYRARFINLYEPRAVSVLITDITSQKNAESALKKSEQILRWSSETAKIGGWELDLQTMTLQWADEIYQIREVEKIKTPTIKDAFNYYSKEAKPIMKKALHEAMERGVGWDLEIPIVSAKGNKKWIRDIGVPEMKNGKCIALRGLLQDITEKKNAELAIQKHEEQLQFIIKGADLGTWDWNILSGVITTNNRLSEMLGYGPNEVTPHISVADKLIHPDDKSYVTSTLVTHLKGRSNFYHVEYRLKHKNGHWIWVLDQGQVVERGVRGKPLRASGTRLDITDRKLNELELQHVNKELEQFKLAINTASIVSMTDTHGRIEFVNKKFTEISKYTREELIGQKHNIINSGYHSKKFWKDMWRTICNGEVWRAEVCNRAKTGELYWIDTFIIPIKDNYGKITKYISIRNEITQRKKDEEKLQLLSMVASQTSNYVIITDNKGNIEWVNESFERASGYTLPEITGLKPSRFLYSGETDPDTSKYIQDMIMHEKSFSRELIYYTKGEEKYWVQITAQPLRDNGGKVTRYFFIMHDITDQKQMMSDLKNATEKAVESDRLKSSFLANISHEIRTPMNAILGFAELLDKPNIPDNKRESFSKLIRARSYDLLGIVNDILDISKIESGEVSNLQVVGNLSELLDRLVLNFTIDTFHLRSENVEIKLNFKLTPSQSIVSADFLKLNQVLTNLLTNATKFTAAGTIELTCILAKPNELLFTINDTGIGIPENQLEAIFKPFHQATEAIHQQYGGSGLGLAICKGLVELWGGRIWAKSKLGHGSTFYFTMPYIPQS